jgi:glycosyltransferase 2 family protein
MNPFDQRQQSPLKHIRWQTILKVFSSLLLIALVLYVIDLNEVINLLISLNPEFLMVIILLIYLDRFLMAYKWRLLLNALDIKTSLLPLVHVYIITPLPAIFLPSSIGGDIFRLFSLSRSKVDSKSIFASIVVERIIGFFSILILATFSLFFAFFLFGDRFEIGSTLLSLTLAGIILMPLIIVISFWALKRVTNRLKRKLINHPIGKKIFSTIEYFSEYRNHLPTLGAFTAWTILEQMVPIGANYLGVKALNIDATFLELVAIIPITVLAIRLPISLDGLGVQEGLYIFLFALIDVSASEAVLLSTLLRILPIAIAIPFGIRYVMKGLDSSIKGGEPSDSSSKN